MKKLFEMGTFCIVDEDDIPPGHKNINCCMYFKIKEHGDGNILECHDCARCNADGRQQEVGLYGDIFAPISRLGRAGLWKGHCAAESRTVCSNVLKRFKPGVKHCKIAGEHQPADIFIKGLPQVDFQHHHRIRGL